MTGLLDPRQVARRVAAALALIGLVVFLIVTLPGLVSVREHFADADPSWVVVAIGLELLSTLSFAVAFHGAMSRRSSVRSSTSMATAALGVNTIVPAGGIGGLAVVAVIMTRAGVPRSFAASRTVALFLVTSLATFAAIVLAGLGVAIGLVPGDVSLVATLLPAVGALLVVVGVAVLPRVVHDPHGEAGGRIQRAARAARVHVIDGIASALDLLRRRDPLVIAGSIGYLAFDIAALAVSFHALGSAALPVGTLVLAYTLGQAGAIVPLPGSTEGGLLGMFVLYGASLSTAAAAILVYRVVQLGVPALSGLVGMADLRHLLRSAPEEVALRFAASRHS